jgi:hypothetical protein
MRRPARFVPALSARMFPNMAITLSCSRRTGVSDPAVADYLGTLRETKYPQPLIFIAKS